MTKNLILVFKKFRIGILNHRVLLYAEAKMVFPIVSNFVKEIFNEAQFLMNVDNDIERLQSELERMHGFLTEANARRWSDERVNAWVKDVRAVTYEVEDLLELYIIEMVRRQQARTSFSDKFNFYARVPKQVWDRHKYGKKIKFLRVKVEDIRKSRQTYGIPDLLVEEEGRRWKDMKVVNRRKGVEDSNLVGLEDEKEMIMDLLLSEHVTRRSVASIVGMGGLGKTTIARNIFEDKRISSHFDCLAWVQVTQHSNAEQLLIDLISKLGTSMKQLEKKKCYQLEQILKHKLGAVRYLIVMDDLWDAEAWKYLVSYLPDGRNRSRVLITTRNYQVAKDVDPLSEPYRLRFLNAQESWDLFLKKSIPYAGDRRDLRDDFEERGRQMVSKCGGLPLALGVLGGLLAGKERIITEWDMVAKTLIGQHFEEGRICMDILALSYRDLPQHLRKCFLYLGAFPKDVKIDVQKLIRLWIAENFIWGPKELTLEESANECLNQLVRRSLVQVVECPLQNVKECCIHSLLHDWVIAEAEENGFFHSHNQPDTLPSKSLRLSLKVASDKFLSRLPVNPKMRALLGFNFGPRSTSLGLKGLKLIRVIDLEGAPISAIPNEIGYLSNLRYLGLRNTSVKVLPKSIKKLFFFQTLDIKGTMISLLDSNLWAIKTLRHVILPFGVEIRDFYKGSLQNLHVLQDAKAGDWILAGLPNLPRLKTLRLSAIQSIHHGELSASLPALSDLVILELEGDYLPTVLLKLSNLRRLETLKLFGQIEGWPQTVSYQWASSITTLTLTRTFLDQDPLPSLGSLRALQILELSINAYDGNEMTCHQGSFPVLQTMTLYFLEQLEKWTIEDGAMPCLKKLKMSDSKRLAMLPRGLRSISTLEELRLVKMSDTLNARIDKERGEDWENVQHISFIIIDRVQIRGG